MVSDHRSRKLTPNETTSLLQASEILKTTGHSWAALLEDVVELVGGRCWGLMDLKGF